MRSPVNPRRHGRCEAKASDSDDDRNRCQLRKKHPGSHRALGFRVKPGTTWLGDLKDLELVWSDEPLAPTSGRFAPPSDDFVPPTEWSPDRDEESDGDLAC